MKEGSFPALLPPRSFPLQAEHLQPPMACGIITKLMDEQKTREALDVLGELYLTGDHFPDKDAPAAVMPPVRTPPGESPPPEPMRLTPTLSGAGTRSEIADSPVANPPSDISEISTYPFVPGALQGEVVVLGNLPVLARPWLSQYARNIAEADGSVVVVHITDNDLDLEVVAPGGQSLAAIEQCAAEISDLKGSERLAQCVEAFQHLGQSRPRRCLIHVDPEQLAALPDWLEWIERWTVLTGADEAAVQATARTIAGLVRTGALSTGAGVGVAVAGCGPEEAMAATAKIGQITRDQMSADESVRVELRDTVSRMVPLRQEIVGTFTFDDATQQMLGRLTSTEQRRGSSTDETPVSVSSLPSAEEATPPMSGITDQVVAASKTPPPATRPGGVGEHEATVTTGAAVATAVPREDIATAAEPDLIAMGGDRLEGTVLLEARCPYDPDIQLAIDRHGGLHLLLLVRGGDPSPALARLLPMRQWTTQHLHLLQLAMPDRTFDRHAVIAAHLFTDQPRIGAELATRCGDALCVHLLARVGQGARAMWYSAELN